MLLACLIKQLINVVLRCCFFWVDDLSLFCLFLNLVFQFFNLVFIGNLLLCESLLQLPHFILKILQLFIPAAISVSAATLFHGAKLASFYCELVVHLLH